MFQVIFHFFSFILVVKPRTLRKVNLIAALAKNPMDPVLDAGGNPIELFQEKPTKSERD